MLEPGASLDEAAMIAHCRHGLANYKVPMRVFPIDDFPKTPSPNGFKIQRTKLREMAEALLQAHDLPDREPPARSCAASEPSSTANQLG